MTRINVGIDADGGAVSLPSLLLSSSITGPSQCGKTTLITSIHHQLRNDPLPIATFDYAGTLRDNVEANDARTARFLDLTGGASAFIARRAYLDLGRPTVGIDILRRCVLPDGTRETPLDVSGRVVAGWSAHFADMSVRTRFSRIAQGAFLLLSAAHRPISEWPLLFESEAYLAFLREEQARLGQEHAEGIDMAWRDTFALLDLKPGPRADYLDSTYNALGCLRYGPLATALSTDSLHLEDLAFGDKRLLVTGSAFPDLTHRQLGFRLVHGSVMNLVERRSVTSSLPRGLTIIDEVGWITSGVLDGIERYHNKKWAIWVSRQDRSANFDFLGLTSAADLLDQSVGSRIEFRPSSHEQAKKLLSTYKTFDHNAVWLDTSSRTSGVQVNPMGGMSDSDGETEAKVRVGIAEQKDAAVDALLTEQNYVFYLTVGNTTTRVFATPPKKHDAFRTREALVWYRTAHDRHWAAQIAPRRVFVPPGSQSATPPPKAPPAPAPAQPVATPPPPKPTKPTPPKPKSRQGDNFMRQAP